MISKDMGDIAESDDWEEIQQGIGDSNQLVLVFDEGFGNELKIDPNQQAIKIMTLSQPFGSPFHVRNSMQMKTALL